MPCTFCYPLCAELEVRSFLTVLCAALCSLYSALCFLFAVYCGSLTAVLCTHSLRALLSALCSVVICFVLRMLTSGAQRNRDWVSLQVGLGDLADVCQRITQADQVVLLGVFIGKEKRANKNYNRQMRSKQAIAE